MTAQAPCAKIARRDPDLADRMWATITVGGREVVDAEKRALGRRVCATCPLRTTCIADSLVGGWKDRNLIGGLDYRRRTVLSKLVCRDLGITARQLHDVPAQRVSDWLERHPDWADRIRLADSSDWRQRKRLQRRKIPKNRNTEIPIRAKQAGARTGTGQSATGGGMNARKPATPAPTENDRNTETGKIGAYRNER